MAASVRGGIMGFLKNNPMQSSRAYPILSDVSGFPGSKIGDTFDSCNIGHGPLKRCGSSGVHPLALDSGHPLALDKAGRGSELGSNMRGGKTHRRHTGPCCPAALPRQNGGLRRFLPVARAGQTYRTGRTHYLDCYSDMALRRVWGFCTRFLVADDAPAPLPR